MLFEHWGRTLRPACAFQGIQVWPSPDVMEKMGAKDALVKVANMNIGLEETRMRGFVSSGATPKAQGN